MDHTRCNLCDRAARYRFTTTGAGLPGMDDWRCLRHAIVFAPVRRRALRVAALVGTILFAINQADVVLTGHLTPLVACKIALTYLVPYSVSTYSALQINHLRTAHPIAARRSDPPQSAPPLSR